MSGSNLPYIPHPQAEAIVDGDLDPVLPSDVRAALLDLILAWANLDMAVAFLAASILGLNPDEGADRFGRKEIADKLKVIVKALNEAGQSGLAQSIDALRAAHPGYALLRRRVAHSRCVGVLKSDPSRIVFLPFDREGPPGHLAIEIFGVAAFIEATEWARGVHDHFLAVVDASGFFEPAPEPSQI